MAKALRRSEEEKKVEANHQIALINTGRLQIAANFRNGLKKVTPPTFHGRTSREDVDALITNMEKYFLAQNYT